MAKRARVEPTTARMHVAGRLPFEDRTTGRAPLGGRHFGLGRAVGPKPFLRNGRVSPVRPGPLGSFTGGPGGGESAAGLHLLGVQAATGTARTVSCFGFRKPLAPVYPAERWMGTHGGGGRSGPGSGCGRFGVRFQHGGDGWCGKWGRVGAGCRARKKWAGPARLAVILAGFANPNMGYWPRPGPHSRLRRAFFPGRGASQHREGETEGARRGAPSTRNHRNNHRAAWAGRKITGTVGKAGRRGGIRGSVTREKTKASSRGHRPR